MLRSLHGLGLHLRRCILRRVRFWAGLSKQLLLGIEVDQPIHANTEVGFILLFSRRCPVRGTPVYSSSYSSMFMSCTLRYQIRRSGRHMGHVEATFVLRGLACASSLSLIPLGANLLFLLGSRATLRKFSGIPDSRLFDARVSLGEDQRHAASELLYETV